MNMKIRALSLFAAACLTATTLGNQSTSSVKRVTSGTSTEKISLAHVRD